MCACVVLCCFAWLYCVLVSCSRLCVCFVRLVCLLFFACLFVRVRVSFVTRLVFVERVPFALSLFVSYCMFCLRVYVFCFVLRGFPACLCYAFEGVRAFLFACRRLVFCCL